MILVSYDQAYGTTTRDHGTRGLVVFYFIESGIFKDFRPEYFPLNLLLFSSNSSYSVIHFRVAILGTYAKYETV